MSSLIDQSNPSSRANFLIYEDAQDYSQLWAKEFQSELYLLKFNHVQIDLTNEVVYVASWQLNFYILAINGRTGQKLYGKYLYDPISDTAPNPDIVGEIKKMVWIPAWNRLAIFFLSKIEKKIQIMRITGTTEHLNPFEVENTIRLDHLVSVTPKWTQTFPSMSIYQDSDIPNQNVFFAIESSFINSGGQSLAGYYKLEYSKSSQSSNINLVSSKLISFMHNDIMSPSAFYANNNQEIHLSCFQDQDKYPELIGTQVKLLYKNDFISSVYKIFDMFPLGSLGDQFNCRSVEVTQDRRAFVYLNVMATATDQYIKAVITEVVNVGAGTVKGVVTYLQKFYGSFNFHLNQRLNIVRTSRGKPKMMQFFNGRYFNGEQTFYKQMGYIMRWDFGPAGAAPLVSKVDCNFPTTWFLTAIITGVDNSPTTLDIPNALIQYKFPLDDPLLYATSPIKLVYQDLPASRIRTPAKCPAVPGSVPLHLPYIEERIYYVIDLDPSAKQYFFALNPKHIALSQCQKSLISYDITSSDDVSPIPRFIQFIRDPLSLKINGDHIIAPYQLEYQMKLVLSDIYGNRAALFFTVLIVQRDTLLDQCRAEDKVVKKPFALDHIYVIGSLWRHKIHIPRPRTMGLIDCSSKLMINSRIINSQGFFEQLPTEIRTDPQYPRLTVYVPRNIRELYDGKTIKVDVIVHVLMRHDIAQRVTFNLKFVSEQPLGCPLYQNLVSPLITNHFLQSSTLTQTDIYLGDFSFFSSACKNAMKSNFRKQLAQSDGSPLPSCITYDVVANKLSIRPSLCPTTGIANQAFYIELKFEAWLANIEGLTSDFKASHAFTTFEIIVGDPYACKGSYLFPSSSNSLTSVLFDEEYVNMDTQVQVIQEQYQCSFYNNQIIITNEAGCLPGQRAIKLQNGLSFSPPGFISLQTGGTFPNWKVDPTAFDDQTDGTYDIRALMWYETTTTTPTIAPYYQFAPGTVRLDLHMYSEKNCLMDSGNNPQTLKYIVQRESIWVTYQLSRFRMGAEKCIYDRVSYQMNRDDGNSGQWLGLPSFVQYEPSKLTLTVETNDTTALGIYHLLLFGSLNPYLNHTHHFTLELEIYPNTDAPSFIQQLQSPLNVSLQEEKSYTLPFIKDKDHDKSFVFMNYVEKGISTAQLPSFIKFDMFTKQLKIYPMVVEDLGSYQFKLDLIDDHPQPKKRSYPFQIIVSTYNGTAALLSQVERDEANKYRHVRVMPIKVDSSGVLMLKFDQQVFQPGKSNKTLEQFNRAIISNVMIEKAYSERTQNVEWKVEKLTNDTAFIKLLFQDPSQVSVFKDKDRLLFRISKEKQIKTSIISKPKSDELIIPSHRNLTEDSKANEALDLVKYTFLTLEGKDYSLRIPRQKRESRFDYMQGSFMYVQGSINTILFGNLLLNILFSSSLQMLWGTINTMQLIMMVTLFNLSFPDNAMFTFKFISQITRFNIIPLDKVINSMFSFDDQKGESINFNFEMMGYHQTSILQTLDSILAFLAINCGLMVLTPFVYFLVQYFPRQGFQVKRFSKTHWYLKLRNTVFFNMTIRLFLESFIEIALTAAINIINVMKLRFTIIGDSFSSYLSMILGFMILIFPIIILVFTGFNRNHIEDLSIQEKYGAFYEGLRLKTFASQLCPFLFTLRRLILVASTVLLSDHQALQVMSFILFSQLNLIYIIQFRPYEDRKANYNEAFNELCILATSYTLFIFTDQVEDFRIRNIVGFLIIAIILFNFAVNLAIQFVQLVSKLRLAVKVLRVKIQSRLRSAGYLVQEKVMKAPVESQGQTVSEQQQQKEKQARQKLPNFQFVKQHQKGQMNFEIWQEGNDLFPQQLEEETIITLERPKEQRTKIQMLQQLINEKKKSDAEDEGFGEVSKSMNNFNDTTKPIMANEKLDQWQRDIQQDSQLPHRFNNNRRLLRSRQ